MNKKGVLGFDTVTAFIVLVLIVAVTAIAAFLAVSVLQTPVDNENTLSFGPIVNETGAYLNQTGYTITGATLANFSGSFVVTNVWNSTTAGLGYYNLSIPAANFSAEAATGILRNGTANPGQYTNVSFTYTYAYLGKASTQTTSLINNLTSGTTDFFSNASTFFTLLGVVVILLIIVLVLIAIRRFEGGTSPGL